MRLVWGLMLAFLLVAPAYFSPCFFGEAEPARSPEEATIVISDFSGGQLTDLSLRPDGGISLKKADDYVSLPEVTVSSAPDKQRLPVMAMAPNGTSLVVWENYTEMFGNNAIYGQMLDRDLNRIGNEICIHGSPGVEDPDVAVDSYGDFFVVWKSGYDRTGNICGQRLNSSGAFLGDRIVLGTQSYHHSNPRVAASRDRYFVVWQDGTGSFDESYDINGQLLDLDGIKQGPEFLIAGGDMQQEYPDITTDGEDRFIVGWIERDVDKDWLIAQVFDSNASAKTGGITVDSRNKYKSPPCLETTDNGSWAIAWSDHDDNSDSLSLFIRTYKPYGNPIWGPVVVSTRVDNAPRPGLIWAPDNEFVTYWADFRGSPSDQGSLWARRVSSAGKLLGQEMAVSVKPSTEHGTSLACGPDGSLYFTWSDESTTDVHARKFIRSYVPEGTLVTGEISAPADFGQWSNLTASAVLQNASANSLLFEYSTDSGTSWWTVPGDGSIAGAGRAVPLRLRVLFRTVDNRTTPILYNITLSFTKGNGPPVNRRPIVTAGPDIEAFKNTTVVLTATGSDEDGDPLTYAWTQLAGPALQLGGLGSPSVSFVPSSTGIYRFRVVARDLLGESLPGFVNVTVRNRAPTVSAPPDLSVRLNSQVLLNVSGQDPDGDELAFTWGQVGGDQKYIEDFTGPSLTFPAKWRGTFRFRVVASDGEAQSEPAFFNMTVFSDGNTPPSAIAGPDITCYRRSRVQLGCTAFDSENDPLTFTWAQVEGEPQPLSDPGAVSPWFFANRSGTYRFRVVVSDGEMESQPDFLTVMVVNRLPNLTVERTFVCHQNDLVVLNANGTDPDGDPLTYIWSQTSGGWNYPAAGSGREISFFAVRPGRYQFRVVASDGESESAPATVSLTVLPDEETFSVSEFPFWAAVLVVIMVVAFVALILRNRGPTEKP